MTPQEEEKMQMASAYSEQRDGGDDGGLGGGDPQKDPVLEAIGDFGKWQMKVFMILGLFFLNGAFPTLILTFLNVEPQDYWCKKPADLDMDTSQWLNVSGQADHKRCTILDLNYARLTDDEEPTATRKPCTEWEYKFEAHSSSDTSVSGEFDLVCEKQNYNSISQSVYFFGSVLGVTISGVMSDLFGRKVVTFGLLLINSLVGIACSQMTTFEGFVATRFLTAFFSMGLATCSFTWLMEVVGGKYKTICGLAVEYFWTAGWLTLALFAYLIRGWRYLTLAISIPGLLVSPLFFALPESPRWLLSTGKVEEAEEAIRKIAKFNGRPLADAWCLPVPERNNNDNERQSRTIWDLFITPNLRKKTVIIFFNWFAVSFAYYGLTLNSSGLGGNLLLTFVISGVMEIPAYTLAMLVLLYMGRRIPYSMSMIGAGACLLSITLVPEKGTGYDWIAVAVGITGKTFVTFSFGTIFLFSAEMFPTVIRNTGMGCASCLARMSAMFCGWIATLGKFNPHIPVIIYGFVVMSAGLTALFLPETSSRKLPDTIEESERIALSGMPCKKTEIYEDIQTKDQPIA